MKYPTIFFIGFLLLTGLFAPCAKAESEIDSLQSVYEHSKDLRQQTEILLRLTKLYWGTSPARSLEYGNRALELSKKLHDKKQETRALLYLSVAHFYVGENDSCIYYSKQAVACSPGERKIPTESFGYNLMSISYKNMGEFDSALKYAMKSYAIRKTTADTINIAGSLDNIAHIYRETGNYEKALEYTLQSLDLFLATKDTMEMAKIYAGLANLYSDMGNLQKSLENLLIAKRLLKYHKSTLTYADIQFNLADTYLEKEQYDSALVYFQSLLPVYLEKEITDGVAEAYQDMGLCYAGKKEYKKAREYLHRAQRLQKVLKSKSDMADVEIALGKIFLKSGQYDSADFYLQNAYRISKNIAYSSGIKSSLEALAALYEKSNHPGALAYYKRYVTFRDSIQGAEVKMKMAELQTKHETSKKEKKILQLQVIEKTQRARNQQLFFLLIVIILIFIAVSVFVVIKRKSERESLIKQKIIAQKDKSLAMMELNQQKLKTKHLEKELNYKMKQLTTHSLNMMQKSELLQDIIKSLDEVMRSDSCVQQRKLAQLKLKILHILKSEKDWQLFKMYFENINKTFVTALKKYNPDLTENEIRLSALIKMGLTIKEIASILNVSPQSVKNARYRLKNKLNLPPEQDLNEFMDSIE